MAARRRKLVRDAAGEFDHPLLMSVGRYRDGRPTIRFCAGGYVISEVAMDCETAHSFARELDAIAGFPPEGGSTQKAAYSRER